MQRKQDIREYFSGNYLPFYEHQLSDLKRDGKEYKAVCPFHDDTDPSLSINPETGRFHCFGCKAGGDIFTFYAKLNGLSFNGDFPKVCQGIISDYNIPTNGTPKKSKIVETYDYRDPESNDIAFQKVRTKGKGFYIRSQVDDKWKKGLNGHQPILYRLSQVIEADEVNIVEGEKDADNLAKLGFAATTNFNGAGNWNDGYNRHLEGKTINIFPDNDEQGKAHALMVANKLHGIAESVKIIELDGLADKQDVSDYIAKFDDLDAAAESLAIIIDKTPEYESANFEDSSNFQTGILNFQGVISLELPEKRIFLDPWITEKSITLISGWRGTGKTWLALSILDAISKGKSFGLWETETSVPCLYVDGEMPIQDMQYRAKQLEIGQDCKSPIYLYSDDYATSKGLPRANLLDENWRGNMKAYLLKNNIKLWVVDNIASLAPGINENAKEEWDPINEYLLTLRFAGIATILLHHVGKAGWQRGTSAREDNIDTSIILKQPGDYETEEGCRFVMEFKKNRVVCGDHFLLADQELQYEGGLWTFDNAKVKTKTKIIELLEKGVKNKDIASELGVSSAYVSKVKNNQQSENFG